VLSLSRFHWLVFSVLRQVGYVNDDVAGLQGCIWCVPRRYPFHGSPGSLCILAPINGLTSVLMGSRFAATVRHGSSWHGSNVDHK
jgi:hypothetical protein